MSKLKTYKGTSHFIRPSVRAVLHPPVRSFRPKRFYFQNMNPDTFEINDSSKHKFMTDYEKSTQNMNISSANGFIKGFHFEIISQIILIFRPRREDG